MLGEFRSENLTSHLSFNVAPKFLNFAPGRSKRCGKFKYFYWKFDFGGKNNYWLCKYVSKWVWRSLLRSAIGRYQKLFIDLDHNDPFDGQNRCRLKINISVSSEMFRIFDDVKIISTTPPAIIIFVVKYKNNNREKQKQNQAQDSFQLSKLHASWAVIGQWFAPLLPWYSEIRM